MAVERYTGVYDADGGFWGEARYVVGHLLGRTECSLCDITHSPIRRKPEWDQMTSRLRVPFVRLHRNEVDGALRAAIADLPLPLVVAHHTDGTIREVLSAAQLRRFKGSVATFETALTATERR